MAVNGDKRKIMPILGFKSALILGYAVPTLQSIPVLCNCLFSIGLSSLVSGHTPALACAPNNRVADCLAIILAHMPLSPTPNNVYPRTGRYDSSTPNNTFGKCRKLKSFTDDSHDFMLTLAKVSCTVNVKGSSC